MEDLLHRRTTNKYTWSGGVLAAMRPEAKCLTAFAAERRDDLSFAFGGIVREGSIHISVRFRYLTSVEVDDTRADGSHSGLSRPLGPRENSKPSQNSFDCGSKALHISIRQCFQLTAYTITAKVKKSLPNPA